MNTKLYISNKLLIAFFILCTLCPFPQLACFEKKRLIIDCDGDLDDMIAIMSLISNPQIEILAITTTGNGKTHYEYTAQNILRLLAYANISVPVAQSNRPPLEFAGFYPPLVRKKTDEIFGLDLPKARQACVETDSSDFIIEKILSSDTRVSLLCAAPLTNLARALKKEPGIKSNIDTVVVIAGALNVKGNIEEKQHGYYNKFGEYNIFLDSKAADIVFNSGLKVVMVPLDATYELSNLTTELYRHLVKQERNIFLEFLFNAISQLSYPYFGVNKSVTFVGLLGSALITNPSLIETIPLKLKLNHEYGPYFSMLTIDRNGFSVDVCLKIQSEKFFLHLINSF
jgi:inosine-uridine nucleoside N-ribohydrolase